MRWECLVCLSFFLVQSDSNRRKSNRLMNRLRLFVCPGGRLNEKGVAFVCWNWEKISIRRGERCKVRLKQIEIKSSQHFQQTRTGGKSMVKNKRRWRRKDLDFQPIEMTYTFLTVTLSLSLLWIEMIMG